MPGLGWGVVGIGGFLTATIAPAMAAEPNCRIVAAASRDLSRASEFASKFDVPNAYDDYEAMLDDPAVDAVYIATPNALHPEQVIAAARAGKHVYCDKPIATNATDAEAAVRACLEAGVYLGVNFHNRFLPWVHDVTAMIASGELGDIQMVELDVGSGPRHYANWRADPALAGLGSVHNVGVHPLDFLRVMLDAEPVEVATMFDRGPDGHSVEMLALILVRFDDGTLVYCNCNEKLTRPTNGIVIHGTQGRVTGAGLTRSRSDGELTVVTGSGEATTHYPATEAHRIAVAEFAHAVLDRREPSPSGLDGLRSAQLCEAIGASATARRVVGVAPLPQDLR
jgi:1,5-anhydro-D-fructose reductase (1,5-anhydro-D-mannitol-forming)